jgi:hypothetical protein
MMMNSIFLTLIAFIVLALISALMMLGQRLGVLKQQVRDLQADVLTMKGAVSALCQEEIDADRKRGEIEQRLRGIRTRQDELELRDQGDKSYAQAIKLIHRGAKVDDIIAACGLNRGEAELIASLHGAQRG